MSAEAQTPDRPVAIETVGLSKSYGTGASAFQALNTINLRIGQNEFFTLLGPSGCGKTTLLRLIAGFDFPTDGQILLDGADIALLPPFRRPINTVFQSYALFPHMSVAENIGFGLKMQGMARAQVKTRVDQMLQLVRMEALADRKISAISGGQQQRVALARALAPQPKVLLLDEPLSALDYKLRKEMQTELKRLQHETGITFVFVTHDQDEALTMSDRIAVMSRGRVLQVGDPREIYNAPADRFVADFIGESNFLTGRIVTQTGTEVRVELAGTTIDASAATDLPGAAAVTVMIRPEHVDILDQPAPDALVARVEAEVFIGTDTRLHLRLSDGAAFVARAPNNPGSGSVRAAGAQVWLRLHPRAARVLGDHDADRI